MSLEHTLDHHDRIKTQETSFVAHALLMKAAPWLAGSGIAMGQAMLATSCTVPKIGKCAGCGSCVVAVIALSGWALKKRKSQQAQGLEPFEVRTGI